MPKTGQRTASLPSTPPDGSEPRAGPAGTTVDRVEVYDGAPPGRGSWADRSWVIRSTSVVYGPTLVKLTLRCPLLPLQVRCGIDPFHNAALGWDLIAGLALRERAVAERSTARRTDSLGGTG